MENTEKLAEARAELAPSGSLVAGINLANPLLVSGRDAAGQPVGIAPDLAAAIAERLGVPCMYKTYPRPGETADGIKECGIVLIAFEAQRAETIAFSPPYVEIETTYLLRPGSVVSDVEAVDAPGTRIVVSERSAYDLYLSRTLRHAELVRINGLDAAFEHFKSGDGDALAGLRPALLKQAEQIPGARLLAGNFTSVGQAVGTAPGNIAGRGFVRDFILEAVQSSRVAAIIAKHGVEGLKLPQAR